MIGCYKLNYCVLLINFKYDLNYLLLFMIFFWVFCVFYLVWYQFFFEDIIYIFINLFFLRKDKYNIRQVNLGQDKYCYIKNIIVIFKERCY